jgi:hypothetical protein
VERGPRFKQLVTEANAYLRQCQDALSTDFELRRWPRYDWDQETRQLVFSEKGQPRVVADIQFVGSISTLSDTWLWSWANDTVDGPLTVSASKVKLYGEEHDIPQLYTKKWHAHEPDGWEMTAIAALLLGAKGAYRSPDDDGATFMIMSRVWWAS